MTKHDAEQTLVANIRRNLSDLEELLRRATTDWEYDEANESWLATARPMVEAFFHARFMLEMVVKAGRTLEEPPQLLPSGWAAVLYLYGLRRAQ